MWEVLTKSQCSPYLSPPGCPPPPTPAQVGEMHILWIHTPFPSRVRLEEEARAPERLVPPFRLLHGVGGGGRG